MSFLEQASIVSVYVTTIIWCLVAVAAYIDCWKEWVADKRELEATRGISILVLVAKSRFERATYFIKMAHMKVFTGIAATLLIFWIAAPLPDASPIQVLIRVFFILDIYWFWRAKRTDRVLRSKTRASREG